MLSVIIICKNEAEHIGRCLASVAWADEIIVLDSGSTDNTVAICKQYTTQVSVTDWPGFGPQKQRALETAKGDWVLSIDADEQVTSTLKDEILQAMLQTQTAGFEIPRLSSYCGKQIRHGGWWPDYVLRLFQRGRGHFSEDIVHERVIVDGHVKRLNAPLLHDAFTHPGEVLAKMNNYSTLGAKNLLANGKTTSLSQALLRSLWAFFRTYIVKAAFLDGLQGLMLSISNAEGTYYKYIKLLLLQNQRRSD